MWDPTWYVIPCSAIGISNLSSAFQYPRRLIVSTDWCRLQTYAHRIKYLGYYQRPLLKPSDPTVSDEAFRTLSNSMPTSLSLLCPNICGISWHNMMFGPDDESCQYLRLFLGPHTQNLELQLGDANMGRLSLLPTLPSNSPGITHIYFPFGSHGDPGDQNMIDAVSDSLCQWHQLECVHCNTSLSPRAWAHLARLPKLQEIHAFIYNHAIDMLHTFPQPALSALQTLYLCVDNLSTATSIINLIQPHCQLHNFPSDIPLKKI